MTLILYIQDIFLNEKMTTDFADHEITNRNYWGSMADHWVEPGRRSWSTREITGESGGLLVFMRNGTLSMICTGASEPVQTTLQRDWFNLKRLEWDDDDSVEFHLTPGAMIRVLRKHGFDFEDLIDIQAPADAPETRFEYMNKAWARQWPSEEIWRAKKRF